MGNSFWIEVFHVARASIAASTTIVTDHTLARAGKFLAGSVTLDFDGSSTGNNINARMSDNDDSELTIGKDITGVSSVIRNGDGGARTIGAIVCVFMRGSGH